MAIEDILDALGMGVFFLLVFYLSWRFVQRPFLEWLGWGKGFMDNTRIRTIFNNRVPQRPKHQDSK
ncbi:MAG TPA: hypothetical protein VGR50_07580 [Terriglobales bacterium]|nr:hypothetical protein [Terriglobales bacterium]